MEAEGFSLPVLEAHCEYRQPARYDDEVDARASGALLSPVRVRFTYELTRASDGLALATGHTVHAAVGRDGKARRLPDKVRELFA